MNIRARSSNLYLDGRRRPNHETFGEVTSNLEVLFATCGPGVLRKGSDRSGRRAHDGGARAEARNLRGLPNPVSHAPGLVETFARGVLQTLADSGRPRHAWQRELK